jgi:hypothetical protein
VSLLDRIVPRSALRFGRLTDRDRLTPAEILERLHRESVVVRFPGGGGVRVTRSLCEDAGVDFDALKAAETARPVDPAALWGEHDRRAGGQQ